MQAWRGDLDTGDPAPNRLPLAGVRGAMQRLLITTFLLVLARPTCAALPALQPYTVRVTANGFAALTIDAVAAKVTGLWPHLYAHADATQTTPNLLYDAYFGVKIGDTPAVWATSLPQAATLENFGVLDATGIVRDRRTQNGMELATLAEERRAPLGFEASVAGGIPVVKTLREGLAGNSIERELAMVKVKGKGDERVEALRLADAFRARVIDATTESFVFEITGKSDKVEQFIALMLPLGLVEVSRTGIAAIARGPEGM